MATSMVSPSQASSNNSSAALSSASASNSLTSEDAFLKLLVAQIQNQDPLNPDDGIQFLTQLTGFSQLEQLMQINQELAPQTGSSGAPSGTTAATGSAATSGTAAPAGT
jgi:flagellar basal-body rod modification protein FlgD